MESAAEAVQWSLWQKYIWWKHDLGMVWKIENFERQGIFWTREILKVVTVKATCEIA